MAIGKSFCSAGATSEADSGTESPRALLGRTLICGALAWVVALSQSLACTPDDVVKCFDIPAQSLPDALDRFSEQSGLQVVYEHSLIAGYSGGAVSGSLPVGAALDKLLAATDLKWEYVNARTILFRRARKADAEPAHSRDKAPVDAPSIGSLPTQLLNPVVVSADPRRVLPNTTSDSSFGFAKPLLETPRSASLIGDEAIEAFGLDAVEDLVRVAPGVFTTTRYGIEGSVDVRAVPADMFFRGMRRLSLQGHARSVLAAIDRIEIVAGPPSPLYGLGKIGGYTNVVPKSGRAQNGSYLTEAQGFVQAIGGKYERRELSAGAGGPLPLLDRFDKHGGYYIYALDEDSGSFAKGVPVAQRLLQAAVSIENFAGPLRLEAGANYQVSRTAGALTGRFTQDLVDDGIYIRGTPLVDLDANGNGRTGFLEMHRLSPARGPLSAGNQPLVQYWNWPTDAGGRPLPIGQFPQVAGIPQSLYDYLVAHPETDPTGALRAQGVGGPLPQSGYVPIGMALDPRTVGYDTLDLRRAAAYEKELRADFTTVFFDLVNDSDPDFTIKNQLFFDRMDQFKHSNQPFGQVQDVHVIEDKLTVTKRLENLPAWLRVNSLGSINLRNTVSRGKSIVGDFASHRTDAMVSAWTDTVAGLWPSANFVSPIENSDLATDGYPWGNIYDSEYSEMGLGVLFDIDVGARWNFLLGGRYDGSHARNVDRAGSFNPVVGTSANPGQFAGADERASAWDDAVSWSVSASRALTPNVRPYLTVARSAIVLDGNNNALSNNIIRAGHLGAATLAEFGVKASLFDERLFATASVYQQARADVDLDDAADVISAYPTATAARGASAEIKWVPTRNLFLSAYVMHQVTRYDPNAGSAQVVDARTLGFRDVLDSNGHVIYPAEAFLYGGRARIVMPANLPEYEKKQGNPELQFGFSTTYQWAHGLGFTFSGNHFSDTCTGRLCTVRLPEQFVANAGIMFTDGRWTAKLDVSNLFDETYFRARTGDLLGNPLAQVMPDRRWQITLKSEL
jgi:iron complex outermembrane receptor protein